MVISKIYREIWIQVIQDIDKFQGEVETLQPYVPDDTIIENDAWTLWIVILVHYYDKMKKSSRNKMKFAPESQNKKARNIWTDLGSSSC